MIDGFDLQAALDAYHPAAASELAAKEQMQALLRDHAGKCFDRSLIEPGHFTASCWLLDADGGKALLTHHTFLQRWLQLGGHADGDPDLLAGALREAVEESGIDAISPISSAIFDLDVHPIPANPKRGEGSHLHYDVRFLLRTQESEVQISDESLALGWFTPAEMTELTLDDSVRRMIAKWRELQPELS